MASLNLVAALKRTNLRPLGAEGRTVFAAQEQLRGLVASRLGSRHAALLAESLANSATDTIEWYSTAEPPFARLSALEDADKAAAMGTFELRGHSWPGRGTGQEHGRARVAAPA